MHNRIHETRSREELINFFNINCCYLNRLKPYIWEKSVWIPVETLQIALKDKKDPIKFQYLHIPFKYNKQDQTKLSAWKEWNTFGQGITFERSLAEYSSRLASENPDPNNDHNKFQFMKHLELHAW